MVITALLLVLSQTLEVQVKEKSPEVRVLVRGPKGQGADVLLVRRSVVTSREGGLEEGWAEVLVQRAEAGKDSLKAEVVLGPPGAYQILLGSGEVRIAVSRADFKSWNSEVTELRASARRLEAIAVAIDQAGLPSAAKAAQIRKRLQDERERLQKMKTGFNGSLQALEEGVDRLYFHRILLRIPETPDGETAGRYGPPKENKEQGPTAVQEVRTLNELISREGMVLLLDELRLLVEPEESGPGEVRVLRWRERASAIAAIRQSLQLLGGSAELERLLSQAEKGSEPEDLRSRIRKERDTLCKP